MVLDTELGVYARLKPELLLVHEGKFVLVHEEEFVGVFETLNEGYAAGLSRFGLVPFLVKKLTIAEPVYRNKAYFLGLNLRP